MAILNIVKYPNTVLETECEPVLKYDKKVRKLLNDMYETMLAADGVGLAAPQIGITKNIAVVDIDDEHGRIDLINPILLEARGEQIGPEGCLSFPNLYGEVTRADYIKVRANNRYGKVFVIEAEGFLARAILHEMDHLHGVLFTTKVNRYYEPGELEEV
ncbi:peptide deformylase [Ectobacillus polymachus]|uniref:peptide deformylase n=1 Tax=Ectobacillus polymachus TaxID=1508806 RepID=UPI003A890E80